MGTYPMLKELSLWDTSLLKIWIALGRDVIRLPMFYIHRQNENVKILSKFTLVCLKVMFLFIYVITSSEYSAKNH